MALHPLDFNRAEWLLKLETEHRGQELGWCAEQVRLFGLEELPEQQPEVPVSYPIKFATSALVWHVKSGTSYRVVGTPEMFVLELTREPAYAYLMPDGRICLRCQSEFEDGRFVSDYDWKREHAGNEGSLQ